MSGNPHGGNGDSLIQFTPNIVSEQLCLGTGSGDIALECVNDLNLESAVPLPT